MQSFKPTIIVLILAALGVAAMVAVARRDQSQARPIGQREMLLSKQRLPDDEIVRITLQRRNDRELVFERTASGWVQSRPFAHPMDAFSVRQLAQQALQLEVMERLTPTDLPSSLSLSTLSLDPPEASVTYEWSGDSLTLKLGKSFVAGRAYLQIVGDEAIYVVNQPLHERAIAADPREWRERAIFLEVGVESDRIERHDLDHKLTLFRDRKQWTMIEPVRTRLDPAARDAFMQELARARVSGFILDQPQDLSRFGLSDPVASITVMTTRLRESDGDAETADDSPHRQSDIQTLQIGSPVAVGSQDRFGVIEGRPAVVRIPALELGSLFRKAESLAAATASGAVPADVKSIVIRARGEELKLERDLEKWRAPSHDNVEAPAALVDELLQQLTALQAPDVQFKDYPRELEVATVTLHGFDGKAFDTVRIAQEVDAGAWILENGDNVLRVFPPGLELRLAADDYGLH
jgi:hypothetical protein